MWSPPAAERVEEGGLNVNPQGIAALYWVYIKYAEGLQSSLWPGHTAPSPALACPAMPPALAVLAAPLDTPLDD